MARFRKIDPRIWNDERFLGLSDRGKLLFFFLLTHPHMTALGAFRASIGGLASEIRWPVPTFRRAFAEVRRTDDDRAPMVEFCAAHGALAMPNFIRYNRPQSPNVVKSWAKAGETALDLIPECGIRLLTVERTVSELAIMGDPFRKALPAEFRAILKRAEGKPYPKSCPKPYSKPSPKPSLNMKKEKEKEKEKDSAPGKPSPMPSPKPSSNDDVGSSLSPPEPRPEPEGGFRRAGDISKASLGRGIRTLLGRRKT